MAERPTTIRGFAPGEFEDLLRLVLELDTPDGYKAEIVRGKIVVSPWSRPYSIHALRHMRQALQDNAPEGHLADTSPFLFAFRQAKRAFGPDVYVAEAAAFDAEQGAVDGAALSLVAELTSVSTRDVDWQDKLAVYGRLVPVYLVVDMQDREVTAFWEPSAHGYRARHTVPFGEALRVPEPFGFELDTSGFEGGAADAGGGVAGGT